MRMEEAGWLHGDQVVRKLQGWVRRAIQADLVKIKQRLKKLISFCEWLE